MFNKYFLWNSFILKFAPELWWAEPQVWENLDTKVEEIKAKFENLWQRINSLKSRNIREFDLENWNGTILFRFRSDVNNNNDNYWQTIEIHRLVDNNNIGSIIINIDKWKIMYVSGDLTPYTIDPKNVGDVDYVIFLLRRIEERVREAEEKERKVLIDVTSNDLSKLMDEIPA